ncbi:hypothetical protein CHGG_03874 [Chaetomium globosum CBS 148.51]|uniref:Uncharacterized protein n=1 Tax=Chaetomium globosum (strain ATCC 6205 / CBS 148.51 / DSM 1962 / NBRC 6347 / NRRL 1970) TaxID=306901 RepID=Q2H2X2_CHAGB|nr:uncharacterized protein CHGG_03874 [Chaetomium globosum CBS 148.51]EAQ87255.1 hypothetical protein CHGG_03874 [Chaetomium globosum CBS 148.51]
MVDEQPNNIQVIVGHCNVEGCSFAPRGSTIHLGPLPQKPSADLVMASLIPASNMLSSEGNLEGNQASGLALSSKIQALVHRLNHMKHGSKRPALSAANYVHIVEPQWNPSVEEQAIAGAVRMGQTRAVTIIRYVVKNSVEEVS